MSADGPTADVPLQSVNAPPGPESASTWRFPHPRGYDWPLVIGVAELLALDAVMLGVEAVLVEVEVVLVDPLARVDAATLCEAVARTAVLVVAVEFVS